MQYVYSNDNESLLEKVEFYYKDGSENVLDKETRIKYDELKRQKSIIDAINGVNFTHTYEYVTIGDRTSNLVASETYSKDGTVTSKYNYIYDEYGNIVKVKEDGKLITRYTYDGLNRLVREDNKKLDSTVVYVYDIGGNIIRKEKYSYTLEDNLGDGTSNTIYRYSDKGWNDQLVEYGDYTIEYDDLGNPKSHNGNTLEWSNVRQLTGYGSDIKYTYDMNGRRIEKSIFNGNDWISTKYYLDGDRILAQDDGNYMEFMYGISGVEGFIYKYIDTNDNEITGKYRYRKNILGDIIGIIDEDNKEIVRYVYDAYGNHKVYLLNGSDGYIECDYDIGYNDDNILDLYQTISKENPFRYRGYYYDVETQLFYCNSRYYSPELCRFISPDSIEYLDPESINGLNLYAYCGNDPVNKYDPSGHFAITTFLICLGVGALVGGTLGGITAYSEGQDILTGVLTGALLGAAVGAVVGIGGAALSGAVSSVLGKTTTDLISVAFYGGEFGGWEDYAMAFAFGGLTGSLGSVTGKFAGLAKAGKFAADVALRPAANQLVKMGTRGNTFNRDKYLYDVITRTVTYGGSNSIMKSKMFGLNLKVDLGKCFYRSTFRSLYSYI